MQRATSDDAKPSEATPHRPAPHTPTPSRVTSPTPSARQRWFGGLPFVNRALLLSGGTLIGVCALSVVLPLVGDSVSTAVRPYTVIGKQETCVSNLQWVHAAMQLYLSDSDGRYPPLDNNAVGQSRVTWVTLLGQGSNAASLQCPVGASGDTRVQSGYGYNPVLGSGVVGGVRRDEVTNPRGVLLLADRGTSHDVSLLPPLPGWQQSGASGTADRGLNECNLAFLHQDTASVLYADGHAAPRMKGEWLSQTGTWGASLALRSSLERVQGRDPLLRQIGKALNRNDEASATGLLKLNAVRTRSALVPVLALWRHNQAAEFQGEESGYSQAVEARAWRLARLSRDAGENTLSRAMTADLSRRSQELLQAVQSGAWQQEDSGADFSLERPAGWTITVSPEGRYIRTYLRSGSPWVSVQIEVGTRERTDTLTATPVDWYGEERVFRQRWGKRYSRVKMRSETLGWEEAGAWDFTVERDGEPRLGKMYVGRARSQNSFVLVCTAPAQEWAQWQPVFARIKESFRFAEED